MEPATTYQAGASSGVPPATLPQPPSSPRPAVQQGCLCGRKCIPHPVFACTWAGFAIEAVFVVGGLVGGILAKSMSSWIPIVCYTGSGLSTIHLLVNGCQTFYLCSWHPKKTLEQVAEGVTQAVAGTEAAAVHVEHTMDRLDPRLKELTDSNATLTSSLQEEKARVAGLVQSIENREAAVRSLASKVDELTTALTKTSQLKTEWQRIAQQASKEISSFNQSVQKFTTRDLEGAVVTLHELSHEADADSEEAQALVTRINSARQGWVAILQKLYAGVQELTRDVEMKARILEERKTLIDQLRGENTQLEGNMQKLQPMINEFGELTRQYQTARENFDRVMQKLEAIRQLPATSSMEAVYAAAQEAIAALKAV